MDKLGEDFIKYTKVLDENILHFNELEKTKQEYKKLYRQNPNDKELLKKIKLLEKDYEQTLLQSEQLKQLVEKFKNQNGGK